MKRLQVLRTVLAGGASVLALIHPAAAKVFDVPDGDLSTALSAYMKQSKVEILYADNVVRGHRSGGAKGDYSEIAALTQILKGTGFTAQTMPTNAIEIVPQEPAPVKVAQAEKKPAPPPPQQTGLETVVVTAQKKEENIQTVPIAVTALTQQQLTDRQIAGGPDLIKEVPNLTFSKTNFSGYNLEIRGIGTQAISVTTDPAVAVAFNDTPFIRNHFFEQEFYDLDNVEVLRGPQGTLYGRNATAGVVNIISAKPTDTYEAMLSADMGNYSNRRLEAMLNLPIVGDALDLRIAGEWTKRDGYTEDTTTNTSVDGRDLWSGRMTLGWKPSSNVQTYLVWEHFSEDDDRLRSGKQLCKTDYGVGQILNTPEPTGGGGLNEPSGDVFTQGCLSSVSLYSPQAFEAPLSYALPYVQALDLLGNAGNDPYNNVMQSTNLRQIQSTILPQYRAKNDTLEFNANWSISPALTFTSQTGYNHDFLWSTEDFNRFGSNPGFFPPQYAFCDPQLGCTNRLVVEDLSTEHAWQFSQEFRVSSNFDGPLNFTAGANYLHYETLEKYYVFSNTFTQLTSGVVHTGFQYDNPALPLSPFNGYIDPNPIGNLNDEGHNYFLSQNPYVLNSYAVFGDANYNLANDLKIIAGLRWTDDQKHFPLIPSWLGAQGYGYPTTGVVNQSWERFTGRAVVNWTPQLDFTDQTLFYGSYSHGYKAGGANPPGALFFANTGTSGLNSGGAVQPVDPIHPLTFKPEYIEALELGSKNTVLDGALTLNGDIFYYNYTGYQISEIVDRTAINTNYNAHVEGAEVETNWEPSPGLKFGFTGGYEQTGLAGGEQAVDLMDRTAGHPGWFVTKPFVTEASNCIFPAYVAQYFQAATPSLGGNSISYCSIAYLLHRDPLTGLPYVANPTASLPAFTIPPGYPGFDPLAGTPGDPYQGQNTFNGVDYGPVGNNGQGFSKNLADHQLPNAPHFTASLTAEYTMPVSDDWAATFHTDLYWQSQQWARVFEDPIDKIHSYSNVNVSLILTSVNGWQVMGYVKNVFDTTAITGTFLNSDDTGLTTNVFLTDPRLYGIRVTKHLDQNDGFWGSDYSGYDFFTGLFSDTDNGKPSLWIELGGGFSMLNDAQQPFSPPFFAVIANPPVPSSQAGAKLTPPVAFQHPPHGSFDYTAKITYEPEGTDWVFSAAVRYGRAARYNHTHQQTTPPSTIAVPPPLSKFLPFRHPTYARYVDAFSSSNQTHAIFDFDVGKDVGLGMFGMQGASNLSAGVRIAQLEQSSSFSVHSDPDYVIGESNVLGPKYHHSYSATERAKRSFHGLGPSISWNGSASILGDSDSSGVAIDWGTNGAVLFGRQIAQVHHQTTGVYRCKKGIGICHNGVPASPFSNLYPGGEYHSHYQRSANPRRSRMVTVPNIGAFAGVSWHYRNAKVSFGYRADEFFGAMDGGIDTRKSENVGFFGPYANLSIGLGG